MPTITDPNVVKAIAKEYVKNGRVKPAALETIGYSHYPSSVRAAVTQHTGRQLDCTASSG